MIYKEYLGKEEIVVLRNEETSPITEIGDKAFLSKKQIVELTLPSTVTKIGQWGFAHMKSLRTLVIPRNDIGVGKEAFLDCPNLNEIRIYPDDSENEGLSYFMAVAITVLKDLSLFNPAEAGTKETHANWMKRFDKSLLSYISEDDEKGFQPVLYGWFNDEGEDDQKRNYIHNKRISKTELCFLRLKYNALLNSETEAILNQFICNHVPGDKSEPEHTVVWEVICGDFCKELINVKTLEKTGALYFKNRQKLIDILTKNGINPEIIAYLVSKNMEEDKKDSAFLNFNL